MMSVLSDIRKLMTLIKREFIKRRIGFLLLSFLFGFGLCFFLSGQGPFLRDGRNGTQEIISSEVTVKGCQLKVKTTEGKLSLDTGFEPPRKCYQFLLHDISFSKKFLAYQGLSGGVDSMVQVYSVDHGDNIKLDVLGTSEIFDIVFLPNDCLAVLNGYREEYDEFYLRNYDVGTLFSKYPENVDQEYNSFKNVKQSSKVENLPDVGKDYMSISQVGKFLEIYGPGGGAVEPLTRYRIDEVCNFAFEDNR